MALSLPTYLGKPVLDWRPDWQSPGTDLRLEQEKSRWDESGGPVEDDPGYVEGPRTLWTLRYVLKTRARVIEARELIQTVIQGRLKSFWVPTWSPDFRLAAGTLTGSAVLTLTPSGYKKFLEGDLKGRAHVALFPRNTAGSIVYREIVAAVEVVNQDFNRPENEVLTLDLAMANDLNIEDPGCWLLLCRAASDELVLVWENADIAVLELTLIDLPRETPTVLGRAAAVGAATVVGLSGTTAQIAGASQGSAAALGVSGSTRGAVGSSAGVAVGTGIGQAL